MKQKTHKRRSVIKSDGDVRALFDGLRWVKVELADAEADHVPIVAAMSKKRRIPEGGTLVMRCDTRLRTRCIETSVMHRMYGATRT
jgi:hypothetical protein